MRVRPTLELDRHRHPYVVLLYSRDAVFWAKTEKKKKKMQTADGDTFVIVVHYETTTHFNVVDCLGELQQKQVGNKSGNCIRMCINYL